LLIIDDNALNIDIAEIVLTEEGFQVESATDSAQGLQRVASFQPDLILMDIQMPDRDGLELTRMIKADPTTRSIRIVAFTAAAMRGDEAKFRAAGCDGYLSKPIDVNKFGAQVRAFLQAPADHAGGMSKPIG
jgi:two-component system cell cycle response regulator DivK